MLGLHNYPLDRIWNMDETAVHFDMPKSRTITMKGTKDVFIKTCGFEQQRVTVLLTISASLRAPVNFIFSSFICPKVNMIGASSLQQLLAETTEDPRHLRERFPGRSDQIRELSSFISLGLSAPLPPIYLSGLPATGKTSIVKAVFESWNWTTPNPYAYIDCAQSFTSRLLFEDVLSQLSGVSPCFENGYTSVQRCDNLSDFAARIHELCGRREGEMVEADAMEEDDEEKVKENSKSRFLIFDNAERLRDMTPTTIIPALLRLGELSQSNVNVLFISRIIWDKFRERSISIEPYFMHFPDYEKNDVGCILALDCPPEEDPQFFLEFVDLVYTVFHKPCRDLNELRHIVLLLYPKYVAPINAGKVTKNEKTKLFNNIQYYFKETLEKLYMRKISTLEWQKDSEKKRDVASAANNLEVDLPYNTAYLLFAAFLASYNPPRFDVRFFSRQSEGRKRRRAGTGSSTKLRQQLLGPKAFPVDRMLAIFFSIMADVDGTEVQSFVDLQMQITALVSQRLLVRMTNPEKLESMKLKCNVNFDFISALGRKMKFDISKYLFEFT
ncbi:Origin recognition complex subunit 5 [Chytridiales sp. JEL 0842]|nr:Origin recognition complex subunit 5 [Chytridiales sp. JEL 0842]